MSITPSPFLEAVYYATPIPRGIVPLTLLGIVFDRIHFPDVWLPEDGYDPDAAAAAAEAKRIEALAHPSFNTSILIGTLRALPHVKHLKEFCVFADPATSLKFGEPTDADTGKLMAALETMMFGPPPENFVPHYELNFNKGLPGGDACIGYPGPLQYPATALTYAAKRGIPIVNDDPSLPVPGLPNIDAKHNAQLLASILALECVNFALPHVRPLQPSNIVELRSELRPHLHLFRPAVLKLSQELNRQITNDSSAEDIQKAAAFLVKTEVEPTLAELRHQLAKPSGSWLDRAAAVAKDIPALATAFATMPPSVAYAQVASTIMGLLLNMKGGDPKSQVAKSGMYYLLRLQDANAKPRDGR